MVWLASHGYTDDNCAQWGYYADSDFDNNFTEYPCNTESVAGMYNEWTMESMYGYDFLYGPSNSRNIRGGWWDVNRRKRDFLLL